MVRDEPAQKSRYALGRVAADVAIVLAAFASTYLMAGAGSSFLEATRLALPGAPFAGLVVLVYARRFLDQAPFSRTEASTSPCCRTS